MARRKPENGLKYWRDEFPVCSTGKDSSIRQLAYLFEEFLPAELKTISTLPIVPTKSKSEKGPPLKWLPPSQCYFGSGGEAEAGFHSKLFVFVDFGPQGNNFLHACGTKREPSVEEVTLMLLADPHGFYELADGPTK